MVRSTAQMHPIGNLVEEATAAGFAALALGHHGELARALEYGDRAVALARDLADPSAIAASLFYRATVYDQKGAWTDAIADCDAARRAAEAAGDRFQIYLVNLYEGWTRSKSGAPGAGRVLLEQGLSFAETNGTRFLLALGKAQLAECSAALDESAAPALCKEALIAGAQTSDRLARAVAHRALAETLMRGATPDRQQVEQAMCESIQLLKEIEFNPELARTYVKYSRQLRAWGQRQGDELSRQRLGHVPDDGHGLGPRPC